MQVPADYIRLQTIKNAERFITPELKDFEDKALSAQSRALAREKTLYEELLETLNETLLTLQESAATVSELDMLTNLGNGLVSSQAGRHSRSCVAESQFAAGSIRPEGSTSPATRIQCRPESLHPPSPNCSARPRLSPAMSCWKASTLTG